MLLWIILLLPLASFGLIALFLQRRHYLAATVSTMSALIGAGLALHIVSLASYRAPDPIIWISMPGVFLRIGPIWDPLAKIMLLVVTCIGALIHVYSWGYMREDPGRGRFFGYLSLFMFSMLGVALASNFIMMFIFWELVGLSSYLLIGFWFNKPTAADAGKKAFLVNKIGDFGFLLGIVMVWSIWNTVDFTILSQASSVLRSVHANGPLSAIPLGLVALLLFCGAVGKSAQLPLHVWLPDAMEGPTPVSALIHAATMVAAGVYMLCRVFFILAMSPHALLVIAWVGGLTALLAALWAVAQDDIKRILAYSTLSQLGYMVMAVGLTEPGTLPDSAMFHLSTHACFKALLFLGAGSVIISMHHQQNIWKMGGLLGRLPVTSTTFLVGLFALCGMILFSGSLSKDEILALAYHHNQALFWIGVGAAFLTAFYMTRLFVVAFLGKSRGNEARHAQENGLEMTLPLVILAFFSLAWVWNLPPLARLFHALGAVEARHLPLSLHYLLRILPVLGMGVAWILYRKTTQGDALKNFSPALHRTLASKFYFDEFYDGLVRWVQGGLAATLRFIDVWIVDGLLVTVLVCTGTRLCGNVVRGFQTGNLQTYAIYLGIALATFIYWAVIR